MLTDTEKRRQRRAEIKEMIDDIKKANPCKMCGCDDFRCLEFHHIDPKDKKFSIFQALHNRYSKPSILREIAKTEILCANCHRRVHYTWEEDHAIEEG